MTGRLPKLTIWRAIFAAIMVCALYATYLRVVYGLGGATNLSDRFPWGLWIAFDILCGVGLASGGFTLVAIVHIFNIERYKPVLRPAILTAFLGFYHFYRISFFTFFIYRKSRNLLRCKCRNRYICYCRLCKLFLHT